MKTIDFFDLAYILGGDETSPSQECADKQNEATREGKAWSDEEWDDWADDYIAKGCTHAVIYG